MRSLRLMGEEVLPAVREMAKELDLPARRPARGAEPVGISPAAMSDAGASAPFAFDPSPAVGGPFACPRPNVGTLTLGDAQC